MASTEQQREFADWRAAFLGHARSQGLAGKILAGFESRATLLDETLSRQQAQAEFLLSTADYMARVVSAQRVADGRDALAATQEALAEIELSRAVDRGILTAIWGIESSYGQQRGSFPVLDALASLAACGRRREMFEAELLAALRIIEAGAADAGNLVGSWAGAMGHVQFMPSSYLEHAVAFRGSGRPDIWSDDPRDALASAANYLARHGWTDGLPWGFEIRLPTGFDLSLTGLAVEMPAEAWQDQGIRIPGRFSAAGMGETSIIIPAGATGPAVLVTRNFHVLRRYNNSLNYALAVGLLSELVLGRGGLAKPWPSGIRPLTLAQTVELQQLLSGHGHDTGGIDGIAGPSTVASLQAFQDSAGLVPDGLVDQAALDLLRSRAGGKLATRTDNTATTRENRRSLPE